MSVRPVNPGETIEKPATAVWILEWRWASWLQQINTTAEIDTSTFAISEGDGDGGLTKDNDSIVTGNLKTRIRIAGGTKDKTYRLTNTIVTNESPTQTDPKHIFVKII